MSIFWAFRTDIVRITQTQAVKSHVSQAVLEYPIPRSWHSWARKGEETKKWTRGGGMTALSTTYALCGQAVT